jgi:hypothetical protein
MTKWLTTQLTQKSKRNHTKSHHFFHRPHLKLIHRHTEFSFQKPDHISRLLKAFEPIGNRREEFGEAEGRMATERAGASESTQAKISNHFYFLELATAGTRPTYNAVEPLSQQYFRLRMPL